MNPTDEALVERVASAIRRLIEMRNNSLCCSGDALLDERNWPTDAEFARAALEALPPEKGVGEPVAWMTPDRMRALTAAELRTIPEAGGRRQNCTLLYPIPLYASGAVASGGVEAVLDAAMRDALAGGTGYVMTGVAPADVASPPPPETREAGQVYDGSIEVREDDKGGVDEIVGLGVICHLERMSNGTWFMCLTRPDQTQEAFWLAGKGSVDVRHQEHRTAPATGPNAEPWTLAAAIRARGQ